MMGLRQHDKMKRMTQLLWHSNTTCCIVTCNSRISSCFRKQSLANDNSTKHTYASSTLRRTVLKDSLLVCFRTAHDSSIIVTQQHSRLSHQSIIIQLLSKAFLGNNNLKYKTLLYHQQTYLYCIRRFSTSLFTPFPRCSSWNAFPFFLFLWDHAMLLL